MIITENLSRKFDDFVAVENLNIHVKQGEVFGFLGPNGAGKTTTVRMLASLIHPSNGWAKVNDYLVGEQDDQIRRSVGLLTETPGMYDNLSAMYNLMIYANLYEINQPNTQVEKYLRLLGLWERRFDLVGMFSKGMRQKLAIARALLHEPRILFLDEPTVGLDPEAAHLVRNFISELKGEGRTIFICTHNLEEADRLCDRIAVFKTRLLVMDSPARLRSQLYGRKIVFHLTSIDPTWVSKISAFPFVNETHSVDNKIIVTLENPEEHNPQIVNLLVQEGAMIQFVGELRHSLEDVYLQMVRNA